MLPESGIEIKMFFQPLNKQLKDFKECSFVQYELTINAGPMVFGQHPSNLVEKLKSSLILFWLDSWSNPQPDPNRHPTTLQRESLWDVGVDSKFSNLIFHTRKPKHNKITLKTFQKPHLNSAWFETKVTKIIPCSNLTLYLCNQYDLVMSFCPNQFWISKQWILITTCSQSAQIIRGCMQAPGPQHWPSTPW